MTKEERFNQLEQNLKGFEQTKIDSTKENGLPVAMSNFGFYCMCYYPLVEKIQNDATYNKQDEEKLEYLDKERDRIDAIPYIEISIDFETGKVVEKKHGFEENK